MSPTCAGLSVSCVAAPAGAAAAPHQRLLTPCDGVQASRDEQQRLCSLQPEPQLPVNVQQLRWVDHCKFPIGAALGCWPVPPSGDVVPACAGAVALLLVTLVQSINRGKPSWPAAAGTRWSSPWPSPAAQSFVTSCLAADSSWHECAALRYNAVEGL